MTSGLEVYPLVFWAVVAMVVAPLMAVLGVLAQADSGWSVLPGLFAALLVVYVTAARPTGPDHIRPWSQWVVYLAAAALAVAFTVRAAYVAGAHRNAGH